MNVSSHLIGNKRVLVMYHPPNMPGTGIVGFYYVCYPIKASKIPIDMLYRKGISQGPTPNKEPQMTHDC